MLNPAPQTVYLKDYTPPPFLIDSVELGIDIESDHTIVRSQLEVRRNPAALVTPSNLVLDGDGLELVGVSLNGRQLSESEITFDPARLEIHNALGNFQLQVAVRIFPTTNTQLMGLYASKDGYFTQCEAEGFRRITYFLDRPDVMSVYTTTISADKKQFPLLLSNGNLESESDIGRDRHKATWLDPFPKPAYLFAMVAAKLDRLTDDFRTMSGRTVKLSLFVEPGKLDQADFAMESLKSSMRWDEDTFGLELDLDQYMIVAVSDFNMGAMENKGLNIFNTKYVLASASTATDTDFMMIDRVIAHEYFHNWTGNRVTCRDWFQLSLKEGLTVFRDQRYGEDRYSRATQRIQEVRALRASQFPEDAGPMAHPVRPEAYMEISNFYTSTVYNKGAEVVRMIHTLVGVERFRKGMDLYFERHDGQAVCTEEFVAAMQDASNVDLSQFKRWYSQAGTPKVRAWGEFDALTSRFTLHFQQSQAATAGQSEKLPLHIPIAVGLLDRDGKDVDLGLSNRPDEMTHTKVLSLTEPEQSYTFEGVSDAPVPSLLRHFSAPINLEYDYEDAELAHLLAHDSDPFNRWEAGQRLMLNVLLRGITAVKDGRTATYPDAFLNAIKNVFDDADTDPAFAVEALTLPGPATIAEHLENVDPDAIMSVRLGLRKHIAERLQTTLLSIYERNASNDPYSPTPASSSRRALRNLSLSLLMDLETPSIINRCAEQLRDANNMTDAIAALGALANCDCAARKPALDDFHSKWRHESLVLDKWFAVQSGSRLPSALADVKHLMTHENFDLRNPNKVRAVIGMFCHNNFSHFNAADGSGYDFASEQIIQLDTINPQIAARLARAFDRWRTFDTDRQKHACAALERIRTSPELSKDTTEVVGNILAVNS